MTVIPVNQPTAKQTPIRILVAFACVYFFWGSTYVAIRFGVAVLNPFVIAAVRFAIAGPLMLALCAARGLPLRQTRRDLAVLALIGVLMLGIGNVGLVWAEQYLPSGLAALLIAVVPLYVALVEALLPGGEGLRLKGWIGIAIGFMGLVILLLPGIRESLQQGAGAHSGQLLGSVVAVVSALGWVAGSILSRRSRLATPPFVAAAWEMFFAGLFNLGLVQLFGAGRNVHWTAQGLWSIAWLVTFGSLVGYTAYIYLLDHVPVAKVSTYAYINPIVAVGLGALFLHERLVPIEYAGMAAVLVAVYLVTSSRLKVVAPGPQHPHSSPPSAHKNPHPTGHNLR